MLTVLVWFVYYSVYAVAGFSLKFGDDLLDELDKPLLAWLPLAIAGVLFGMLMSNNEWDFALLTAIVLGVLVSGKVNRLQYIVGFLAIGVVLVYRGIPQVSDWQRWLLIVSILFVMSIIDEIGNDWSENKNGKFVFFFRYRLTLKVSLLVLALIFVILLPIAIAIWIFDLGYEAANSIVNRIF